MNTVVRYLETFSDMGNDMFGLIRELGSPWEGPVKAVRLGPLKECYCNSMRAAAENGWVYVEGIALGVIPVQHAWCVRPDGVLIETTWEDPGTEYFGVPFSMEGLLDIVGRTGFSGVFCNAWLLREEWAEIIRGAILTDI